MKEPRNSSLNLHGTRDAEQGIVFKPRISTISVQFSHPADDSPLAADLRMEGLVPLLINDSHVAATTADNMQEALDAVSERITGEPLETTRRFRLRLMRAMVETMEAGATADFTSFSDDALLLLAEGLVHHGYRDADALPFCAVRFMMANVDAPEMAHRPDRLKRRFASAP